MFISRKVLGGGLKYDGTWVLYCFCWKSGDCHLSLKIGCGQQHFKQLYMVENHTNLCGTWT